MTVNACVLIGILTIAIELLSLAHELTRSLAHGSNEHHSDTSELQRHDALAVLTEAIWLVRQGTDSR